LTKKFFVFDQKKMVDNHDFAYLSNDFAHLTKDFNDLNCSQPEGDWYYLAEKITYAFFLPLLTVFGIFGNSLILLIYTGQKERHQSISIILSFVALVDNLMLIFTFLIFTLANLLHIMVNFVQYLFALALTLATLSVWIDCLISFERFLAVCRPMKHKAWLSGQLCRPIAIMIILTVVAFIYCRNSKMCKTLEKFDNKRPSSISLNLNLNLEYKPKL
jgi:hypothetical protein